MIGGLRLDPSRGQNNLRFLENVAHLAIRDLQGEGDDPRMLFTLRYAFARLAEMHARDARLITFDDLGHSFRFDAVEWGPLLADAVRDPAPAKVVRLATRADEGRAAWIEILKTKRPVADAFAPQVRADVWARLDEDGRREYTAKAVLQRTARLAVERTASGEFVAKSEGVAAFRILLTRAMLGDLGDADRIKVTWNGRARTKPVRESSEVLLAEFAERFDRTFLPVAEVRVP
jgi:hypothetical protein